jgi:hypothetical protein
MNKNNLAMSVALAWCCALAGSAQAAVVQLGAPGETAQQIQERQRPRAMAQYRGRMPAFLEAQQKAAREAGARIDDNFVIHWFGKAVLESDQTPLIQYRDEAGLNTLFFQRDSAGWVRKATLVTNEELQTAPLGSESAAGQAKIKALQAASATTLIRAPSR